MIKIIADSTSDLSDDILKRYDIDVLPLYIHLGENEYKDKSCKESFYAINIVEGMGTIEYQNNICNLKRGDSIIIPAYLGEYTIRGKIELLKSYVD